MLFRLLFLTAFIASIALFSWVEAAPKRTKAPTTQLAKNSTHINDITTREIKLAIQSAKVSLLQAIKAALKKVPGRTLNADVNKFGNRYYYNILVVSPKNNIWEIFVNMSSGDIIGVGPFSP